MEKFFQNKRGWQGLWGLDQLHWSIKTKLRWNQGNIVYFQKQKWVCKFQWQGLENKLISGSDRKRNGSGESDGKKFGANAVQVCLWRSLCWQGRMHLETLEVSLNNFDEKLCWWVFRGFAYDSVTGLEKRIRFWKWGIWLSCIRLGISRGQRKQQRSKGTSPTSLKSTTLFLGSANYRINSWTIISDLIGAWMLINVNWYFPKKCIANTLHWLCFINIKVGIFIIGINDHDLDLEHRLVVTMLTSD